MIKIKHFTLLCFAVIVSSTTVLAQKTPSGKWEGAIILGKMQLKILVDFKTEHDSLKAKIDIPQQMAKGLALKNVAYNAPALSFDLESPIGLAKFKGTCSDSNINGSFEQSTMLTTFFLKPYKAPVEEALTYKQEEVTFFNKDIKLTGTLTLPENTKGTVPAVILITGSGTENRDEEIFDFKIFKIIANHFTKNGIAVLRYDDRGAGGSSGNGCDATTADFAKDAEAAFQFLKARPEINGKKIGLMGHSEGGGIAAMVAANNKNIAFVISMAGTALSGEDITLEQVRLMAIAAKKTDAEVQETVKEEKAFFEVIKSGKGMDEFKKSLIAKTKEALKKEESYKTKSDVEISTDADKYVSAQLRGTNCAWYKYFITYNPATEWTKTKCPVLGLFGGLDTQVPAITKEEMRTILRIYLSMPIICSSQHTLAV
jgi:dienelactone hydrolase